MATPKPPKKVILDAVFPVYKITKNTYVVGDPEQNIGYYVAKALFANAGVEVEVGKTKVRVIFEEAQ